jgi:hypothetical protein
LKEKLNPMTPPEVREQRELQFALQIVDMVREAREVAELFEKTA